MVQFYGVSCMIRWSVAYWALCAGLRLINDVHVISFIKFINIEAYMWLLNTCEYVIKKTVKSSST